MQRDNRTGRHIHFWAEAFHAFFTFIYRGHNEISPIRTASFVLPLACYVTCCCCNGLSVVQGRTEAFHNIDSLELKIPIRLLGDSVEMGKNSSSKNVW